MKSQDFAAGPWNNRNVIEPEDSMDSGNEYLIKTESGTVMLACYDVHTEKFYTGWYESFPEHYGAVTHWAKVNK